MWNLPLEGIFHRVFAIERHVSIVHFENHGADCRSIKPTAGGAMTVNEIPATLLMAARRLSCDEEVSHSDVPAVPFAATEMMQDLCSVVVEIHVGRRRALIGKVQKSSDET